VLVEEGKMKDRNFAEIMDNITTAFEQFREAFIYVASIFRDKWVRVWYGMPWELKEVILRYDGYSEAELQEARSYHYWGRMKLRRSDLWPRRDR